MCFGHNFASTLAAGGKQALRVFTKQCDLYVSVSYMSPYLVYQSRICSYDAEQQRRKQPPSFCRDLRIADEVIGTAFTSRLPHLFALLAASTSAVDEVKAEKV